MIRKDRAFMITNCYSLETQIALSVQGCVEDNDSDIFLCTVIPSRTFSIAIKISLKQTFVKHKKHTNSKNTSIEQ